MQHVNIRVPSGIWARTRQLVTRMVENHKPVVETYTRLDDRDEPIVHMNRASMQSIVLRGLVFMLEHPEILSVHPDQVRISIEADDRLPRHTPAPHREDPAF